MGVERYINIKYNTSITFDILIKNLKFRHCIINFRINLQFLVNFSTE